MFGLHTPNGFKTVVAFVFRDFVDNIAGGSKYPTRPQTTESQNLIPVWKFKKNRRVR